MDPKEIAEKADLAISDLSTGGGLLNVEQSNQFIREIMEQPTIINDVRTIPMNSPQMELNKIGFGNMILKPARWEPKDYSDGSDGSDVRGRALIESERSKPTTSKVLLETKEVIAEIRIPYEVLEDNIERGQLQNTILSLIAERASLDLENYIINASKASTPATGEELLAIENGILARTTANIVDHAGDAPNDMLFNNVIKALPKRYRRNKNLMRLYVPMDVEQDYRFARSQRGTGLGDNVLTGNQPLPVFGVPMRGVAMLPDSTAIFTNPQNIIFGIQRNIRVQSEQMISEREVKIVLTARVAVQLEDQLALVKATNIGEVTGA